MFSCNIYEIFKNNYFEEHLRTTASAGPSMTNLNMILPEKMVNVIGMIINVPRPVYFRKLY